MSESNLNILVGCDPEIALRNPNSKKFVSAEGILPGDKLNPHKVNKGTIQVDGFAAEIGIDPARSAEEFSDNVETVLEELKKFTTGYDLVYTDHVIFDEDVFLNQSDKGRELGCEPDYSAYTGVANNPPVPNPPTLRTMSGHIHIGWGKDMDIADPGHFADCIAVTKQMDWFLGVPGLIWNPGTVRRKLYGKAGAFRVKSYGVEYRTPDNSWLRSRDRMKMMFDNAVLGMNRLYAGEHLYEKVNAQGFIDRATRHQDVRYWLEANKIPFIDDGIAAEKPKRVRKKKVVDKIAPGLEAGFAVMDIVDQGQNIGDAA